MAEAAIRVRGLSKQYTIGSLQRRPDSLRDALIQGAERLKLTPRQRHQSKRSESIWALKDVSFEVQRGEILGVIGRNGAGKSTLLKILTGITLPTAGEAEIRGRIASLLEVGTGFHPDLTGRENVYLNGAILGMRRREIRASFDEIVAFAEVEKFIDTPVKHYSSGMYVRLAFAVAAHLNSEVLLADEVLAVGDLGFQRKCLGKMDEAARRGRTVLLVSHSMTAVTSICTKGALINAGHLQAIGDVNHVVNEYLRTINVSVARGQRSWASLASLPLGVLRLATCTPDGQVAPVHRRSDPISIQIDGVVREPSEKYIVAVDVKTTNDTLLFRTHNIESREPAVRLTGPGQFSLFCQLPPALFPAGTYRLGLITAVAGRHELQNEYPALEFDVVQDELLGDLFVGTRGVLTPPCVWSRV